MPPAPQHRVPPGSRAGGRFAPAAHIEPDVELPAVQLAGATSTTRFALGGPARLDNVAAQRERNASADRRLAATGLPAVGSRVTVNWGGGPVGEVTLHDLTQDGQQAAVNWDHLPGTSLVPVEFLEDRTPNRASISGP